MGSLIIHNAFCLQKNEWFVEVDQGLDRQWMDSSDVATSRTSRLVEYFGDSQQ